MKIFGERLKDLRDDRKLSLMKLSKQVGISDTTLSRWENDVNDVKGEQLVVLAKFFNVSTDYLLGLTDYV